MEKITQHNRAEIGIAILLIVFLGLFMSPPGLLMPQSSEMLFVVVFIISFIGYIGVFWRERPTDERDYAHQLTAGRISFFVGSASLAIGIIIQALRHDIDPFLVFSLGLMILAKIFVRIYQRMRN